MAGFRLRWKRVNPFDGSGTGPTLAETSDSLVPSGNLLNITTPVILALWPKEFPEQGPLLWLPAWPLWRKS